MFDLKAAENTNMWLIANGIDIGVTSIIGEAVANYATEAKYKRQSNKDKTFSKFNLIGVAEEHRLKNFKDITKSDKVLSFSLVFN